VPLLKNDGKSIFTIPRGVSAPPFYRLKSPQAKKDWMRGFDRAAMQPIFLWHYQFTVPGDDNTKNNSGCSDKYQNNQEHFYHCFGFLFWMVSRTFRDFKSDLI
jgi:hypothetical protein